MNKIKLMLIISVAVIAAVIVAISMVIRQSEREILFPEQKSGQIQGVEVKKEEIIKDENKIEGEAPPRIIPSAEELDN